MNKIQLGFQFQVELSPSISTYDVMDIEIKLVLSVGRKVDPDGKGSSLRLARKRLGIIQRRGNVQETAALRVHLLDVELLLGHDVIAQLLDQMSQQPAPFSTRPQCSRLSKSLKKKKISLLILIF